MNYRQRVKIERRRKRKHLEQRIRRGIKYSFYDEETLRKLIFGGYI